MCVITSTTITTKQLAIIEINLHNIHLILVITVIPKTMLPSDVLVHCDERDGYKLPFKTNK